MRDGLALTIPPGDERCKTLSRRRGGDSLVTPAPVIPSPRVDGPLAASVLQERTHHTRRELVRGGLQDEHGAREHEPVKLTIDRAIVDGTLRPAARSRSIAISTTPPTPAASSDKSAINPKLSRSRSRSASRRCFISLFLSGVVTGSPTRRRCHRYRRPRLKAVDPRGGRDASRVTAISGRSTPRATTLDDIGQVHAVPPCPVTGAARRVSRHPGRHFEHRYRGRGT